MGFNVCHIPKIDTLVDEYNRVGLEQFVKSYRKYDSWNGNSDSIIYLETQIATYYEQIKADAGTTK